ncbi:MAG: hypothetical protein WCJ66_05080 [Verrucomicrobiota bacterium]
MSIGGYLVQCHFANQVQKKLAGLAFITGKYSGRGCHRLVGNRPIKPQVRKSATTNPSQSCQLSRRTGIQPVASAADSQDAYFPPESAKLAGFASAAWRMRESVLGILLYHYQPDEYANYLRQS